LKDEIYFKSAVDMMEKYSYALAPNWNAVLCYCYIDSSAGMSFHFLGFANYDDNDIDVDSYEKQLAEKIVLLFRYKDDAEIKPYSKETSMFNERAKMVDDGYHRDERVLPTRNIAQIDHLRHNSCPDDIKVLLRKEGLQIEQVWVRLAGIENGNLTGVLLNEPNSDFGVHSGDIVCVQVTSRGDDVYAICLF